MIKETKCYYISQAQTYFLSWIKGLDYEPDWENIQNFANNLFPNLLTETDSKGRNILHLFATHGPEWIIGKAKIQC